MRNMVLRASASMPHKGPLAARLSWDERRLVRFHPKTGSKLMPQSTKDAKGGKTHAKKHTRSGGAVSDKAIAKNAQRSSGSPTGPLKHGEKKTTPR
jgi:hypothetical protein